MPTPTERRRIVIEGMVQGVGFRPFIVHLAQQHGLAGFVMNNGGGVVLEAEGHVDALDAFMQRLTVSAPTLSKITRVASEVAAARGETTFHVADSIRGEGMETWVPPDVSICEDCWRELFDPHDRRFHYPFINCTNCGPRYTIMRDLPYDRAATTMASFPMCAECRKEYDDPSHRRFHAQPNACPCCGPQVALRGASGQSLAVGADAIERTAQQLIEGRIVAIKGIGGYHLACDAANEDAVVQLRARKHRWERPLALMAPNLEAVRALCELDECEAQLLTSRQRPIVLLRKRAPRLIAEQVAPRQRDLGVMLPYSPLHYLIFDRLARRGDQRVLVMTSGNRSEEPIAFRDEEAFDCLSRLTDLFLEHNREIHVRCDDSVVRCYGRSQSDNTKAKVQFIRRARGWAPEPLAVPAPFFETVLATGAQMKNTFCLGKGHQAFVSPHVGDLSTYETQKCFTEAIDHYQRLFQVTPRIIAHDLHPEYVSTHWALTKGQALEPGHGEGDATKLPPSGPPVLVAVQHHHAHVASVLAEHGVGQRVIGLAFDGTGYGTDGTIWGGEFLVADLASFERWAHLETIPLLGGEQAIHEVWRLAAAWLHKVYGEAFLDLDVDFVRQLDRTKWKLLQHMRERNLNSPVCSSMGRFFDAVAALIGVRQTTSYEGQAAIELEMIACETCRESYRFEIADARPRVLKVEAIIRGIVEDLRAGIAPGVVAARFHNTIACASARLCEAIRGERGLHQVALGGGVFQNILLLQRLQEELRALNFEVLVPEKLPPNDGAIAFGQAVIANAALKGRLQN